MDFGLTRLARQPADVVLRSAAGGRVFGLIRLERQPAAVVLRLAAGRDWAGTRRRRPELNVTCLSRTVVVASSFYVPGQTAILSFAIDW